MVDPKIKNNKVERSKNGTPTQLIENELLKANFRRSIRSIFGTPKHEKHPLLFHFWNEWNAQKRV